MVAIVLKSIKLCFEEVSEANTTSPITEDTGAKTGGSTSGGKEPLTEISFSDII